MGKVCAIIAAAGKGKRMNLDYNKQFIIIKNRPMLFYTIKSFNESDFIDEIIIVADKTEIDYIREEIVVKYNLSKVSKLVNGGLERQDSVFNGLKQVEDCDIILIQDGARPFVDDDIIRNGIEYARLYDGAAPGVVPKDTIKMKDAGGFSKGTLNRQDLFSIQTPQCFKYNVLLECYNKAEELKLKCTDDTSILEAFSHKVYLYEGNYNNIKITTQEDLIIANGIADKIWFEEVD